MVSMVWIFLRPGSFVLSFLEPKKGDETAAVFLMLRVVKRDALRTVVRRSKKSNSYAICRCPV